MPIQDFNVVLIISLLSWFVAQAIKVIFHAIKYRTFSPDRLFGAGGMPSSHSATVCALAISVSRVNGINSTEFALAMVLALVVMYDATGIRRAAGLHAKEINRLKHIVSELDEDLLDDLDAKIELEKEKSEDSEVFELEEILGHTPFEVLCGALLGIIIAMAFPISM